MKDNAQCSIHSLPGNFETKIVWFTHMCWPRSVYLIHRFFYRSHFISFPKCFHSLLIHCRITKHSGIYNAILRSLKLHQVRSIVRDSLLVEKSHFDKYIFLDLKFLFMIEDSNAILLMVAIKQEMNKKYNDNIHSSL